MTAPLHRSLRSRYKNLEDVLLMKESSLFLILLGDPTDLRDVSASPNTDAKASPNPDVFHRLRRTLGSTLGKPSGNAKTSITLLRSCLLRCKSHSIYCISVSNVIKVLGIAGLVMGSAWVLPVRESERLDTEIKKCAIVRDGADKILQTAMMKEGMTMA